MPLAIIGMSNSGKTYWSKKLEKEKGYYYFGCDDYIQKKLNFKSMEDLSCWLGFPYEKNYQKNSQLYLQYEKEAVEMALKLIENNKNKKIVIDTTGSIVHLPLYYLKKISSAAKIVYLKIEKQAVKKMVDLYFNNPKPVIWGDFFKEEKDKSPIENLKESYPHLLNFRQKRYQKFAHIILDSFQIRNNNFSTDDFLKMINLEND